MVNSHHPFEGNGELAHELGFGRPNHKLRDQLGISVDKTFPPEPGKMVRILVCIVLSYIRKLLNTNFRSLTEIHNWSGWTRLSMHGVRARISSGRSLRVWSLWRDFREGEWWRTGPYGCFSMPPGKWALHKRRKDEVTGTKLYLWRQEVGSTASKWEIYLKKSDKNMWNEFWEYFNRQWMKSHLVNMWNYHDDDDAKCE